MTNNCLNCNEPIPVVRVDSLGRKLTKFTKYCSKKCRNFHIKESNQEFYKSYYQNYYQNNKERYVKK